MSKVFIEESTLSSIGNAIREKNGTTELIAPLDMAGAIAAIEGGGGSIEVEPIVLTGNQNYGCVGDISSNYIKLFGNTITTDKITNGSFMFSNYKLDRIPFEINFENTSPRTISNIFYYCINLKEVPKMNNVYPDSMGTLFESCYRLREIPDNYAADWNWSRILSYNYGSMSSIFSNCYSLRKIPKSILSKLGGGIQTSASYSSYSNTFNKCYALDEIENLPVQQATLASNVFSNIISSCQRLKKFTFETNEDGTPKTANWKNQIIDITNLYNMNPIGYAYLASYILDYNSGITADKEVKDDATYQALKNDADWFSLKREYSRYNHDSAVETINSLPDCSASGGTNTIKFNGASGALTDGGAINTMTEDEIAVAASKGWTVTLT